MKTTHSGFFSSSSWAGAFPETEGSAVAERGLATCLFTRAAKNVSATSLVEFGLLFSRPHTHKIQWTFVAIETVGELIAAE